MKANINIHNVRTKNAIQAPLRLDRFFSSFVVSDGTNVEKHMILEIHAQNVATQNSVFISVVAVLTAATIGGPSGPASNEISSRAANPSGVLSWPIRALIVALASGPRWFCANPPIPFKILVGFPPARAILASFRASITI